MAAYLCDGVGNYLMNAELGGLSVGIPATWYFGLACAPANKFGVFQDVFFKNPEVTVANGYARVAVANNLTNFPAVSGGSKSNGTVITWPTPTGAWGNLDYPTGPILSVFICDAAAGNTSIWRWIDIPPITVNGSSAAPSIAIGALTFSHS